MKRFTETTKWDDPWFRKLTPAAKLLWQWMLDHCDGAGVIDPDLELASFQTGCSIGDETRDELSGRIERLECGKYHIMKFVAFQYGALSEDCKAHRPIFQSLEKHKIERVSIGYPKGIHTLQETDKDTEKEKEKEKEGGVQRGGGFPESEAQARSLATTAGVPPDYAATVWHEIEGRGGSDSNGRPITNFASHVKARWNFKQSKPNGNGIGKPVKRDRQ